MRNLAKSQAQLQAASHKLPLGVTSNFRYWGPEKTVFVDRGKGGHLWDIDGNRYVDYRMGYGPAILGHSDDRVDNQVADAIRLGQCFSLGLPGELEVADKITAMCPSVEMVRFANSGTEATMHALRLARAYTRRDKFIMFEGQYHGTHDNVMFSAGGRGDWSSNRRSPAAVPFSSGIPEAVRGLVILLPYNDSENLERVVKQTWHDVAAILVEPVMGNCGGIMPVPGWLETIRRLCDEHGIVFIMDEVKTGFRLARGGAQEFFGVRSDLTTYAKALGNGYPIAVFGGRREFMQHIGQGVSHAGTYSGNRVGLAAASATLDILMNTDALETVAERGRELQAAIGEVLERAGRPFVFTGHPSMFTFWFAEQAPREYRDWARSDHDLYSNLMSGLIERGVMPEPDSREPWFLCAAHSHQDIADTATALEDAAREVLR